MCVCVCLKMINFWSKPDPKEVQRQTERQLRKVDRDLERDHRELQRDEKKIEVEMEKMAKQLVQLRNEKNRSYQASSRVKGISVWDKAMGANVKLPNSMGIAGKTIIDMNRIMKPEQITATVNAFVNETSDDLVTESGEEEESDNIIIQVLDDNGKMAGAPSPEENRIGGSSRTQVLTDADIEAQLAKLRA